MAKPLTQMNIQELSVSDRIRMAEELWDSVLEDQASIEVTDAQKKALEQRLKIYKSSPSEGSTWEEVNDRLK
ncbi:MAG: addiction module protein [Gammaproteobacteria bacterium]|nr:addiction module protein [Gammaproteobacteria bacterium]